jgi:uncharacterized membrane protein YczE
MNKQMNFSLNDPRRIAVVFLAVIGMGFSLAFLIRLSWGTDPCSCMNLGISSMLGWTFGTYQALFNLCLAVIVFFADRSMFGWGTLANMFLIGYIADFTVWASRFWISDAAILREPVRMIMLLLVLPVFILSASVYMNGNLGVAPYDAIPMLISGRTHISYTLIRMGFDFTVCIIGYLTGGSLGPITIAMALFLGPTVSWVGRHIEKLIPSGK